MNNITNNNRIITEVVVAAVMVVQLKDNSSLGDCWAARIRVKMNANNAVHIQ